MSIIERVIEDTLRILALKELLQEKGIITATEFHDKLDSLRTSFEKVKSKQ